MFSSLLGLSRSFWTASCTVVLFLPIIVRIETRPLRFMVLLWITYFGSYRFDGWPLCFIFSQISDIHISVYVDPGRYEDLKLFIKQVVGTVKPAVVFVTGLSLSLPPLSFPLHLSPSLSHVQVTLQMLKELISYHPHRNQRNGIFIETF